MPPAIQSTMTVSAVGLIFSVISVPAASIARGYPAASAESVAALAVLRKSRRLHEFLNCIESSSVNQLEFRQHGQRPEQIFDPGGLRGPADNFLGHLKFIRGRF